VVCDAQNRYAIVSNYSGGSLSIFATDDDGGLKQLVQHIPYTGGGPDTARQGAPHIHSATFSPDERFLLVQDLGTDHIYVFKYHPENKRYPFQQNGSVQTPAGGSPRHIAFSDD